MTNLLKGTANCIGKSLFCDERNLIIQPWMEKSKLPELSNNFKPDEHRFLLDNEMNTGTTGSRHQGTGIVFLVSCCAAILFLLVIVYLVLLKFGNRVKRVRFKFKRFDQIETPV